ncbi:MAG: prepilin-type N-terminal cleavage/methylation domain-containing protein [Kiritimatiellia bacterium]|nr:prepilin-type N-terminal cleavage/methylation domain-containing protein [Kiritimatiellia bacterium]
MQSGRSHGVGRIPLARRGGSVFRRSQGFSLVEMLAAMAVLSILMVLLGRIFNDSTRAMNAGNKITDVNSSARAVMDFIARDVSSAIFQSPDDANPPYLLLRTYNNETIAGGGTAAVPHPDNILGLRADDHRALFFVAPLNTPTNNEPRITRAVLYRMRHYQQRAGGSNIYLPNRYELMRGEATNRTSGINWYLSSDWSDMSQNVNTPYGLARDQGRLVIQNVRSFSVSYFTNFTGQADAITDPARTRTDVSPLAYLDIRLEQLAEEDAIRAAEMWSVGTPSRAALDFVERAVRRYYRRIYFNNQGG